jgi:hypothetical protein
MTDKFESPIFGITRYASDYERHIIREYVQQVPVTMFQELNKELNKRGFCILIDALPKEPQSA